MAPRGRGRKRGMLDQMPDLTRAARGIAIDSDDSEEDEDAEYNVYVTIRSCKIRPLQIASAWLWDPIMKDTYENPVLIMGVPPNKAAEEPSPYDVNVDVLHLIKHEQANEKAHNLLMAGHKVEYLSSAEDLPEGCDVYYIVNWVQSIPASKIRDPKRFKILTPSMIPQPGERYVAGYAEISGQGGKGAKKAPKKIRRHFRLGDDGWDGLLAKLPVHISQAMPDDHFFIKTAASVSDAAGAPSPPVLAIKRDIGGFVERTRSGPGKVLQIGTTEHLIFANRLPDGKMYAMDNEAKIVVPENQAIDTIGGMGYRIYSPEELLRPSRSLSATQEQSLRRELEKPPLKRRYFSGERDRIPSNDELVAIEEDLITPSVNVVVASHHVIFLLKTSVHHSRLYTFEAYLDSKALHALHGIDLEDTLVLIRDSFTPTIDLEALQHMFFVQAMVQAKAQRGSRVVSVQVAAGILDLMSMDCAVKMQHSFASGNRHLTLSTKVKGKAGLNSSLGFDLFTVPIPIGDEPEDYLGTPCIAMIMHDAEHEFRYNPTTRMAEWLLATAWFTSTGEYRGGAARPDPPADGRQYTFLVHNRTWALNGSEDANDGPGCASELQSSKGSV